MTLPLNVAEAHKSTPPVFRWGIGVHWTLSCDDGSSPVLPALFDTMGINLTRCPGDYASGQVVSSDQLAGTFAKDCGLDGAVSATWDLRSCWQGGSLLDRRSTAGSGRRYCARWRGHLRRRRTRPRPDLGRPARPATA